MKRLLTVPFFVLVFLTSANAQLVPNKDSSAVSRYAFRLNVGSSISSINGADPFLSSYIAPQIQYDYNPKLTIGGGVVVTTSSFGPSSGVYSRETAGNGYIRQGAQSLFFVNGTYRPTHRLSFTAMAYKSLNMNQNGEKQLQTEAFNNNMKGFLFNMDYKLSEHTSVNIGFNYSQGGMNPFQPYSGMSGFGHNGFSPAFSW